MTVVGPPYRPPTTTTYTHPMTRTRVTRHTASSDYQTHRPAPPLHVSLAFALAAPAAVYAVTHPLTAALFAVVCVAVVAVAETGVADVVGTADAVDS